MRKGRISIKKDQIYGKIFQVRPQTFQDVFLRPDNLFFETDCPMPPGFQALSCCPITVITLKIAYGHGKFANFSSFGGYFLPIQGIFFQDHPQNFQDVFLRSDNFFFEIEAGKNPP